MGRKVLYEKESKILLIACCCHILADNIENTADLFNAETKELAERLKDKMIEITNIEYSNVNSASEIVEMSLNVEEMFLIFQKLGILSQSKQAEFQDKFNYLLQKYKIG